MAHTPVFDTAQSQQALENIRFPEVTEENCSANQAGNLAGTASHEKGWFALECPGSWGRDVLDGTAFDRGLAKKIGSAVKRAGDYRFLLIRKPATKGEKKDDGAPRRVFIARSTPGQETLFTFTVANYQELLDLPLHKPEKIPGVQRWDDRVITLMCAHAKRDVCCALRGRPIAQYLAAMRPEDTVWECSHISGHRYAPTGLVLPSGYTYGRLTPETALAATLCLEEYGVPSLPGLRGRSSLGSLEQAAEVAVRQLLFESGEEPGMNELIFEGKSSSKGKKRKKDKHSPAYAEYKRKYKEFKYSPEQQANKHRAKELNRKLKYGEATQEELVELNELNRQYTAFRAEMKELKYALKYGENGKPSPASKKHGKHSETSRPARQTLVRHTDGRSWMVSTVSERTEPARDSCGKGEKPLSTLRVLKVKPL